VSETIIIGNGEITVTVLRIKGNQIRLGVTAPKNINVHRQEIFERIQTEKQAKPKDAA
jgi:carbon storage regulator